MAIEILMPALSPTMEEGKLAKWMVKEGDTVESGDILAEIETDKATMEFEAVDAGKIGKIVIDEGTTGVKINTVIAVLLDDGENIADYAPSAGGAKADDATPSAPSDESAPKPTDAQPAKAAPSPSTSSGGTSERVFATPLARRIAADKGIDLASITGSGPNGRIVKKDLSDTQPAQNAVVASSPVSLPSSESSEQIKAMYSAREFEEINLDGMRKTIAARLTQAKQTIPHFYLRRSINLDALLSTRAEANKGLESQGLKLSINDFIIKACAKALQDVPDANVVWANDRILRLKASDVAVAVSVEGGLFTPVLLDADTKSLTQLSAEMKDLATRARERKLAPHEYQGGSFAISNLGMMGIENFDAVINPPHGSILAVGAGIKKQIISETGEPQIATMMSVTLSVDHRAIDGALGAIFLDAIVQYLENPLKMLV